jgi:hypothetical protein
MRVREADLASALMMRSWRGQPQRVPGAARFHQFNEQVGQLRSILGLRTPARPSSRRNRRACEKSLQHRDLAADRGLADTQVLGSACETELARHGFECDKTGDARQVTASHNLLL